jgi:hypothetical protein
MSENLTKDGEDIHETEKQADKDINKMSDNVDDDDDDGDDKNIRKTNYGAGNRGIVALGIYLVLFTLLTFYVLSILMRAENPEITSVGNNSEEVRCGNDKRIVRKGVTTAAATDSNNNQNQPANNTAANTNQTNTNTTNINTNSTNTNSNSTNVNTNVNATQRIGVNTNSNRTNSNKEAGADADNKTKTTASPVQIVRTELPEVTVPPYLCIKSRFFEERILPADAYLFFVILFCGVLGGLMRGIGSFTRHLGLGDFSFQWTWFYLLLPVTGAVISLAIYLVLRGGFYGGGVGKGLVLNVFAFAALAILTGLFSENAIEKLRQVARTLLTDVPRKVERNTDPNKGNQ